jgi:hypothetical protein
VIYPGDGTGETILSSLRDLVPFAWRGPGAKAPGYFRGIGGADRETTYGNGASNVVSAVAKLSFTN